MAKLLEGQKVGRGAESCSRCRRREVEEKLLEGQKALRRIRRNVTGVLLSVSVVCLGIYYLPLHVVAGNDVDGVDAWVWEFFGRSVQCAGMLASMMAPLPDDRRTTVYVALLHFIAFLCGEVMTTLQFTGVTDYNNIEECIVDGDGVLEVPPCKAVFCSVAYDLMRMSCAAGIIVLFPLAMCTSSARKMQFRMWSLMACVWTLWSVFFAVHVLAMLANGLRLCPTLLRPLMYGLSAWAAVSPGAHERIHAKFRHRFEATRSQHAAAGIAALLGGCSGRAGLALAAERFRGVLFHKLEFRAVADNAPQPELFGLSERIPMQSCDAFISHSWSDDADMKWQAMQRWRAEFSARWKHEPRIWLDKCCIDQTDIKTDLLCLPIFLAGCRELVVLCGTTYLSRLWCILELFTFVHMNGGDTNRIVFVHLTRPGHEEEDEAAIANAARSFDARSCSCSNPVDRDRILSIISAAFGDVDEFNTLVRRIIRRASSLDTDSDSSESESESESGTDCDFGFVDSRSTDYYPASVASNASDASVASVASI